MLGALPEQHRQADAGGLGEGEQRKLKRLDQAARRIRTFVEHHEERTGVGGEPVKSNVTDTERGNLKGPHGVIQGYEGLAVADRAYFTARIMYRRRRHGAYRRSPDGQCQQRDEAMQDGLRRQGKERLDARHCK
jgi:hypothetical protein